MSVLRNPKHEKVAQELAACRSPEEASAVLDADNKPIYDTSASSFASNARKRAQRKDIVKRVAEIRAPGIIRAEEGVGVTVEWMLNKLYDLAEFNLDDYLTAPDVNGQRFYDISKVSRALLGRASEARLNEFTVGRGKNKRRIVRCSNVRGHDPFAAIRLAAQISGFLAPERLEMSGRNGGPIETADTNDLDAARRVAFLLARGAKLADEAR